MRPILKHAVLQGHNGDGKIHTDLSVQLLGPSDHADGPQGFGLKVFGEDDDGWTITFYCEMDGRVAEADLRKALTLLESNA